MTKSDTLRPRHAKPNGLASRGITHLRVDPHQTSKGAASGWPGPGASLCDRGTFRDLGVIFSRSINDVLNRPVDYPSAGLRNERTNAHILVKD